jgi:hypothetical protein
MNLFIIVLAKVIAVIKISVISELTFWFICWQFNRRTIAASRMKNILDTSENYLRKDKVDD